MIQSVFKSLAVLEFVAKSPDTPKSIKTIAEGVGVPVPTCGRILQTLVEADYVEAVAPKRGFVLGFKAYALAAQGEFRKDLIMAAQCKVETLAEVVRENVVLATVHRGRRIMLVEALGENVIQVRSGLFEFDDIYETATGRLLFALGGNEIQTSVIERNGSPGETWKEASSPEGLEEETARIMKQGHVLLDHREYGVTHIAFPVYQNKVPVAGVGIYLPTTRFTGEHRERVINGLSKLAASISKALS